jgi:hypothetical protein
MNAEMLMLIGGLTAFVLTVQGVRHRDLREKYAVIWIFVAFILLICGLFPRLIMSWADSSHLSYPAAVLFIALGAIYLFAFSVSVSLSRQFRRNARLAQELAFLEYRLQMLERRTDTKNPGEKEN